MLIASSMMGESPAIEDKPAPAPVAPDNDGPVADDYLRTVYEELRRLAAFKMAQEAPGNTLQATALVHEAWLRVAGERNAKFNDRTHFFRAAGEAMRRILIDRARRRQAQRHGGRLERVDLAGIDPAAPESDDRLLALDDALERFATEHPTQAEVVKLRYFAGMTNEEVAGLLDISVSSVKNYWAFSRAWLFREVGGK